jgi:hypothetical protein
MSQIDLLDPRASDRFLRAYALLASEYAAGAKSAIDSLLPFVRRAVEANAGSQFDARTISKYVEETYRVRAPIYMMDAFRHRLLSVGCLERPPNAPDVWLCKAGTETNALSVADAQLSTSSLSAFEAALTTFAAGTGLGKPFASENWSEALIKFFAGWDDKKSATVARQLILDSKRLDDRVISSFIGSLDQKGSNYEVAKKLYYGVIVADFFTCITEVSNSDSLISVAVCLDTTLLMRLLGTSGDLLREATEELVKDIQQLGGTAYYFAHTYEELIESLDALSYQATNKHEMNRESAHALTAGETSVGKIQMCGREADIRLGQLGITQHEILYSLASNRHQIDEEGFVHAVGGPRFEQHRVRWERDAQSLALIIRMRQDSRTRNLGQSVAIFVTHNGALARIARDFLSYSSFEVPPILTTDQVSVLAWLERGGGFDDHELSAKLAAACYEAVIPREGWETQFWHQIEELKQADEYRELLNSQVLTNSMRSTILDRSFGEPALARQLELGSILKDLADRAAIEAEATRESGVQLGRHETLNAIEQRLRTRSSSLASVIISALLGAILLVVTLLYLVPAVRLVLNPEDRSANFYINALFALVLSIVTLLALFGITPTIRRPRVALKRMLEGALYRVFRSFGL